MKHALFALLGLSIAAFGCDKPKEAPPQTTAQTAKQEAPKSDVKLVFSFQPTEKPTAEQQAKAKELTALIAESTGFEVEAKFPKTYAEAIKSLKKSNTHVTLLTGWAYLRAHHNADGDLFLADERDGSSRYESAWFVGADSKLAKTSDLKGKRLAFTSPTSADGFLFPYAKLIEDGVVKQGEDIQKVFKEIYFTGDADALKVLLDGKVDAAAGPVFAPQMYLAEGDRAKVKVLAKIDGAPTNVLAVRADFDMKVREKLKASLLGLNDAKVELLKSSLGMQKLVERSHGDHMTAVQNAQETVGTEYLVPEEPEAKPTEAPKGLEAPEKKDTKQ